MGNSKLIRNPIVNHARKVQAEDFHSIENIDVEFNLKCGNCKCGRCLLGGKGFTSKKENSILLKRDWSEKENIASYHIHESERMLFCKLKRRIPKDIDSTKICYDQIQDIFSQTQHKK